MKGSRTQFTNYHLPISHAIVLRPATPFGWHPCNHLIWVHDVAGLAVHAVRRVDFEFQGAAVAYHLVHVGRTEALARVTVLFSTNRVADVGVNQQVDRLILIVTCPRIVHVRHLVEREPPIRLGGIHPSVRHRSSSSPRERLHPVVAWLAVHRTRPPAAGDERKPSV